MREAWTDDRLDGLNGKVDDGFLAVDKRFDRVDKRFDRVDKRFDRVDKRFDRVDDRFERMEERIDDRLDSIQRTMFLGAVAISGTIVTAFIGVASLIVLQG